MEKPPPKSQGKWTEELQERNGLRMSHGKMSGCDEPGSIDQGINVYVEW